MKRYYKITPEGTKDLLFKESLYRRRCESLLLSLFTRRGYNEVSTPGIEFFDLFNLKNSSVPQELMYKMTDNKGRLIVMRPDNTLPIARLVATRMQNAYMPIRFHYSQSIATANSLLSGKPHETLQAGVELIGVGGLKPDLEVIRLAADCLGECFINDYMIEIGHSGIYRDIISKFNITEEQKNEIKSLVEDKSYSALNDYLDSLGDCGSIELLKRLPKMFGSEEIFEIAAKEYGLEDSESLKYLHDIYKRLCQMGLKDKIMVDLSLVHSNDYYSGVIFRGYVEGFGDTVISGGRYDNLLGEFGIDLPATGFAVNVDSLSNLLLRRNRNLWSMKSPDCLVHALPGFEAKALGIVSDSTKNGANDSVYTASTFDNVDEALAFAVEHSIPTLMVVGDEIEIIETNKR